MYHRLLKIEMYHRLLKCQKKPSHTHTCCAACSVLCEDIVCVNIIYIAVLATPLIQRPVGELEKKMCDWKKTKMHSSSCVEMYTKL